MRLTMVAILHIDRLDRLDYICMLCRDHISAFVLPDLSYFLVPLFVPLSRLVYICAEAYPVNDCTVESRTGILCRTFDPSFGRR